MFAIFLSCAILLLWGISAAGSASHWQCEGHGFESRMLHDRKSQENSGYAFKVGDIRYFLPVYTYHKSALLN